MVEHALSKQLAAAARRYLAPLGLTRKGRSRTWLDDQSWFVTVVEFQPSGFSKGSYLNVGSHFLWSANGHLSFDLGYRIEGFFPFESEEQFEPEADRLASRAAIEVQRLRSVLLDPTKVASAVAEGPWAPYHRGVSQGLSGDREDAMRNLQANLDQCRLFPSASVRVPSCERLLSSLTDTATFQNAVITLIRQQREAVGLPTVDKVFE
jgi:hypothetical protein